MGLGGIGNALVPPNYKKQKQIFKVKNKNNKHVIGIQKV
jgi:hypothetical protein